MSIAETVALMCERCNKFNRIDHANAKYCRACSAWSAKPPKLSAGTAEQILDLAASGSTARDVAEVLGCSVDILYRFARANKFRFGPRAKV